MDTILALPVMTKSFKVQTNVSNFALERVLMKEEHLITYKSWK